MTKTTETNTIIFWSGWDKTWEHPFVCEGTPWSRTAVISELKHTEPQKLYNEFSEEYYTYDSWGHSYIL